ncbi:MAG: hypothetical protein ABI785_10935 [Gemmatimonadales bacterium]
MFLGPLLPVSPDLPLRELLDSARPRGLLGVWVRPCVRTLRACHLSPPARRWLLASPDLGFLLARCDHVAVREGERLVLLEAETIIYWRALQVATATPYLPGLARLQALFPGLHATTNGFLVPVRKECPEEVLALCVEEGVRVTGSQIVYSPVVTAGSAEP